MLLEIEGQQPIQLTKELCEIEGLIRYQSSEEFFIERVTCKSDSLFYWGFEND